jgi:ABC-type uncharacterized transport system involved in gliding motility auxiliary subunit
MPKKLVSISGLVVLAAIVLAVNLIAVVLLGGAKWDMTQERLYTLSGGTKSILGSLDDQISAKFYYSKTAIANIPQLKDYAARVLQMLREYQSLSRGKFALEILDPRPDTEDEEWAEHYGLQGVPTNTGDRLFLGLVMKDESGNEQVIPFFHPDKEPTLEYDISKAIYTMAHPAKKKVGVVSSLNITGEDKSRNPMMMMNNEQKDQPWMFIRTLRESYKVEDIETTADSIPVDVDLLLVVHPKNLPGPIRYAIDQYVLRGGKALVFVDPFCQADMASMPNNPQMRMQASYSSNMPDLMQAWGIQMESGDAKGASPTGGPQEMKVVADPLTAYRIPGRNQDVLVLLSLGAENRNADEIITSGLDNILMSCAGALKKVNTSDDIKIVPLFETSDNANTISDMMLKFGPDPEQISRDFKKGSSKIALAYKITGKFKTAFPNGKPAASKTEGEDTPPPAPDPNQLKESKEPGTVIVVGDVDMISDQYSVQVRNILGRQFATAINNNQAFVGNAVENLTGSNDLISLRSRGRSQRPFTKTAEIQARASEQWRQEEESLQKKLQDAEQRLNELQKGNQERQVLDQEFAKTVEKLRAERAATRKRLREVKRDLREGYETLGVRVKVLNIALIPLFVVFAGAGIGIIRTMRKRRV